MRRLGLAAFLLLSVLDVRAQSDGNPQPPLPTFPPIVMGPPVGVSDRGIRRRMTLHQRALRNEERQKKIVADMEKLLVLAQEVKSATQQAGGAISAEIAKKLDEIEKLAREVKLKEAE